MYDMRVLRFASLHFVDSASVRLAGRLDVRSASMHFVDPAFDAVSLLSSRVNSTPDTLSPLDVLVLGLASPSYSTLLIMRSRFC